MKVYIMVYPALITLLTLVLNIALLMMVGTARDKFGVPAPAMTGNLDFERRLRAQMNTIEQTVLFLPALWMWVLMLEKPLLGACIGAIWLVGRLWYISAYINDAKKHTGGFVLGAVATIALILGAFWGIIVRMTIS